MLSCTVIVCAASAWMAAHHDRMPVLLRPKPASESALREWPVSRRVNRSGEGDDDPTIINPEESANI